MSSDFACPRITGLKQIASRYDALLCDVWGVLHNGVSANQGAVEALSAFKAMGKPTFMLTNAPRPNAQVLRQLERLKVPLETTFDRVVTSGDVTRNIIRNLEMPVFHIGTEFDKSVYEGLPVELSDQQFAKSVVCTGLYDDFSESPEDYTQMLSSLVKRGLPFVCANPDIVVEHGGKMRWCAGALARLYRELGGETIIVGKPNRPVYEHAHNLLNEKAGRSIDKSAILAIGDGMPTDIAGALGYGLDVLYISAGIHALEYGEPDSPDEARLQAFLNAHDANPVAWMPRLNW